VLDSNRNPDEQFSSNATIIAGPDEKIALIDNNKTGRWKGVRVIFFVLIATLAVGMLLLEFGLV
jgi:hypothetical protein